MNAIANWLKGLFGGGGEPGETRAGGKIEFIKLGEIAQSMKMNPQTVKNKLEKMERKGLIPPGSIRGGGRGNPITVSREAADKLGCAGGRTKRLGPAKTADSVSNTIAAGWDPDTNAPIVRDRK